MKQCPVCNSWAFDDAQTCFGCLHPFNDEDSGNDEALKPENENRAGSDLTRFVVSFVPATEGDRTVWSCSIEQMA